MTTTFGSVGGELEHTLSDNFSNDDDDDDDNNNNNNDDDDNE